ncbi:MAG: hypothetical protein KIT62_08085 [Cyclobacteriaceae bacterium]|nr:hypothetical protein [Cyclobacteriaceae bacterium]
MKQTFSSLLILFITTFSLKGQHSDTVYITAKNINTKILREGTHRYLVYFKMGNNATRTQTQFWTRTIKRTEYNGIPVIEINQEWEDKDSIMHTVKSISDAKTMQPLYHKTWWKVQTSRTATTKTVNVTTVDFLSKTVDHNGNLLKDSDTDKQPMAIWSGYKSSIDKYCLNWHLDLETFPLLPYKQGATFVIPFYDPGTASGFQKVTYTVTGSEALIGYDDQKIDCWILVHESKGNKEIFWISKKTKEVLKLEQQMNGSMYRYKIKLGFSM